MGGGRPWRSCSFVSPGAGSHGTCRSRYWGDPEISARIIMAADTLLCRRFNRCQGPFRPKPEAGPLMQPVPGTGCMTPAHMSKDLPDSWGIAPYAFAGWTLIVHEAPQRQPFFLRPGTPMARTSAP